MKAIHSSKISIATLIAAGFMLYGCGSKRVILTGPSHAYVGHPASYRASVSDFDRTLPSVAQNWSVGPADRAVVEPVPGGASLRCESPGVAAVRYRHDISQGDDGETLELRGEHMLECLAAPVSLTVEGPTISTDMASRVLHLRAHDGLGADVPAIGVEWSTSAPQIVAVQPVGETARISCRKGGRADVGASLLGLSATHGVRCVEMKSRRFRLAEFGEGTGLELQEYSGGGWRTTTAEVRWRGNDAVELGAVSAQRTKVRCTRGGSLDIRAAVVLTDGHESSAGATARGACEPAWTLRGDADNGAYGPVSYTVTLDATGAFIGTIEGRRDGERWSSGFTGSEMSGEYVGHGKNGTHQIEVRLARWTSSGRLKISGRVNGKRYVADIVIPIEAPSYWPRYEL